MPRVEVALSKKGTLLHAVEEKDAVIYFISSGARLSLPALPITAQAACMMYRPTDLPSANAAILGRMLQSTVALRDGVRNWASRG